MKDIQMMPIGDIVPYANNPRKNKDAVGRSCQDRGGRRKWLKEYLD